MFAAMNKHNLTTKEKQLDSMALNSLLTGLEPRIGNVVGATDPVDILTDVSRMKSIKNL